MKVSLRIYALICAVRGLVFLASVAETLSILCRRHAGRILDEVTAELGITTTPRPDK